jgi:hypothetical protein
MKSILLCFIFLLGYQFIKAEKLTTDLNTMDKAIILSKLSNYNFDDKVKNDLEQIFSNATLEYRVSVISFICSKNNEIEVFKCKISIGIDHTNVSNKSWDSIYNIESVLLKEGLSWMIINAKLNIVN